MKTKKAPKVRLLIVLDAIQRHGGPMRPRANRRAKDKKRSWKADLW